MIMSCYLTLVMPLSKSHVLLSFEWDILFLWAFLLQVGRTFLWAQYTNFQLNYFFHALFLCYLVYF